MLITPVITKIVDVLEADVITIGKVYDHYPLDAKTAVLLKEVFCEDNTLNLCIIQRSTARRLEDADNFRRYTHQITIETRRSYRDSQSQEDHNATIDGILSAFDDDTLDHAVQSVDRVELTRNEPALFYQRLVHYGLIVVDVEL